MNVSVANKDFLFLEICFQNNRKFMKHEKILNSTLNTYSSESKFNIRLILKINDFLSDVRNHHFSVFFP